MQNSTSTSAEGLRSLRHRSITRCAWYDANLPSELIEALCTGDVDNVLFGTVPLQVKDRCVVGRYEEGTNSLLVKRHTWGGLSRTLRMAFRESAAQSCARLGTFLHSLGVRTPRPRATADFHIGPWTYQSYLITDYVAGTPLYRYIRYGSQSEIELRHLARQVAQIWQQMVRLGISHNDFKPENFIIDDEVRVWVIDLEKTRIGGNPNRQRERQVFDVQNFLHVRGWHRRPEARAIFAEAFLQTPSREWLAGTGVDRVAAGTGLSDSERDAYLSALILCDGSINVHHARQAIDSVQDIADEIVLVEQTLDGRLEVLRRIDLCPRIRADLVSNDLFSPSIVAQVTKYPWVLLLNQNECATPFLAKQLQQRITDPKADVALRIVVEPHYFGRRIKQPKSEPPIRLFRPERCLASFDSNSKRVNISVDPHRVGQLLGTIQANQYATVAEFIHSLNEQSSRAAAERFRAGKRAKPLRSLGRAAKDFVVGCMKPSGVRSGWTGLQIAAVRAAFGVFEDAKLCHLAGEFRAPKVMEVDEVRSNVALISDDQAAPAQVLAKTA